MIELAEIAVRQLSQRGYTPPDKGMERKKKNSRVAKLVAAWRRGGGGGDTGITAYLCSYIKYCYLYSTAVQGDNSSTVLVQHR